MPSTPTPQCVRRLQKELSALCREAESFFFTRPSAKSILVWYFVIKGPADTPYEGGRYFGKLNFPPDYPMKPPEIIILTPNGRFETNKSICLTMSNYHPENWSPLWGVRTILTGLLSFMVGDELTTGCMTSSDELRRKYARESRRFNAEKMPVYKELFPEEYQKDLEELKREDTEKNGRTSGSAGCGANTKGGGVMESQEKEQWRGLFPALLGLFAVLMGAYFWPW
ncbi:putative ubiquitin-conjugating enzyme E2 [Trypanosoma cruzi]|uniref:Ubiquitin-conjugating enzyme E2, putative n=2 Tax=Trypanosoma cruzi TaxID=5693 RepID=Q4E305_TRYCC|nr:ubiquitin-conjugating enzyme E2, putative [Trypanosoma cruzi]EAN99171.1 ubiquitin-conjugating enzyme E2, putative [Trypanosoma cruzi]PWU95503.1 putative ubiquitin-conjugating enzyme E2 [Trypanosoma cruzi]RNC47763.1 ubiquitin-conjugating enzyme E2 [Trypanosoma cruzi]|eukprot:XP_821022.1 ubiquitin-conjugating enzyme E2 [Trypanosoma cruzi strain CL Brener]